MKTKKQLTNRILSLVLTLVMVLGMMPMSSFTAFASARTPVSSDSNKRIAALGTEIYIEAGTSGGTAVYYMAGTTKTYINENGASGDDLSGWSIYGGSQPAGAAEECSPSIIMTGGNVAQIHAGNYLGSQKVNAKVVITGGTVGSINFEGNGSNYSGGTSSGIVLIDIPTVSNTSCFTGVYKSAGTWYVCGDAEIPSKYSVVIESGESMTVDSGETLTNNGTIVNNGTITVNGTLNNRGTITNNGTVCLNAPMGDSNGKITGNEVIRNALCIETATSGTPVVYVNGTEITTDFATEYLDGKLYIYSKYTGNIKVALNGTNYYGVVTSAGNQTNLTTAYIGANGISDIPTEMAANTTINLSATAEPKEGMTLPQTIQYELVSDGTTAQGSTVNGTSLYAAGGGIVRIKVTATDGYTSYSDTFDISVILTPVTGLSGEVPIDVLVNQKVTLPTALPANATYRNITWEVVEGTATISNGVFTATQTGIVKIRATIENGSAYGSAYTKEFTLNVSSLTGNTVDVSTGNIVISKENDSQLRVTATGFEDGYKLISNSDVLTITGTASNTYSVTVETDVAANIELNNCSITHSQPFSIASGAKVDLMLVGNNELTSITRESAGLHVPSGAEVIIRGDGELTSIGYERAAGIGGADDESAGIITINGGTVTAKGGTDGAGIGGGASNSGGTITINGGTVTANGGADGAGIGGGAHASGGTITISGGTVTANGGTYTTGLGYGNHGGAGIGGGYYGAGGAITISGGTVTANGGSGGAGIGGGYSHDGGTITISGGTVTAKGGFNGAGIGGGYNRGGGTITISGGTVTAKGGQYADGIGGYDGYGGTVVINGGTVKATAGSGITQFGGITNGTDPVSLVIVTLNGASAGDEVSAITGMTYGLKDVETLDTDKLYFYLPSGMEAATIIAGGVEYICKDDTNTYYPTHDWSKADGACVRCDESCEHSNITGAICDTCGKVFHTHEWEYSVSGTTITATCKADGCPNDDGGYVTISAPSDLTYAGSKIEAVVDNKITTGATVSVTYTGNTTDGYPVNAGNYTASITLDNATIKVEYTIKKATPTAEDFVYTAPTDLIYDDTDKAATVVVKDGINGMGMLNVMYFRYASGIWIDNQGAPHFPGIYKVGIWLTEGDNYNAVYSNERIWLGNEFEIKYLTTDASAIISGTQGSNGWYIGDVTLTAPEGYKISKTRYSEGFCDSFTFSDEKNETVTYYLKNTAGEVAEKTATLKIDKTAPVAEYKIGTDGWKQFINTITFGLFCKDYKTVEINYSDNLSGVAAKQYYIANAELSEDELKNVQWNDYTETLNLNATGTYFIYMRVVDNAGHEVILNTEGIVIYEDSVQVTESVSTTYKAGADKDIIVELNGNTVNTIKNGDDVLAGADYSVSTNGTITLKADYLDTLNAGEYTFTVSYNPLGETYVEAASNDAPKTTTFKVVIEKADGKVSNLNISGKTYDGTAVTAPTFDKLGDGAVTIEYKVKGADDSTYTTTAPKNADDYVVCVTVAEGTNHKAASATAEFTISKVALTVTADAKSKTYGEGDPTLTWNITSGALVNGEQLTGITVSRVSGENANTYAITVSQAEGANKNYDITFVGGTFTINAKTVDATVVMNGAPFIYNGSKQEPEIVVKDGDTVILANEYEVGYASNTNAGTATVTVTDKDGGNYVVNGSTTFIINKATPVIGTVGVDGIVKDSTKPSEVSLTRTDTTVDGVLKLADDAMLANKSTYRWVFTPTDIDNYNVINGDVQIDVLDTVMPTAVIKVDTNEWKQFINNITFGLFFKETQEVTIAAVDNENGSGIKDIVYFVSNCEYEADELRYVEWKSYTEAFDIEPDGKFVIYTKVTDNDGNAVIINSNGVVLDKTAAIVSGITDGETYYGQLVFTVTDELAGVKSVVIDSNDKTHFEGQYVINGDNAEHKVVVTDNAGNVTEYKVTVYKNYTVTFTAGGEPVSTETVGHGKDATLPAVPAKDGYVGKWNSDGKNITEDTTISVVYTEIPVVKPDEVKPEDKTDLEDTKKQLEDMLDDDSYTDDDKKDIQDAIDDIDDALEVIGNVEEAEELIGKLPENITKNDENDVKAADDAYNALSDYEKSLVDEDAKKALDDAKAALAELNKPADSTSPDTGDNSNMFLWIALLFISGGAVITLTVVDRKRRTASKR